MEYKQGPGMVIVFLKQPFSITLPLFIVWITQQAMWYSPSG